MYRPETACVKRTSVIKQLCNHKLQYFAMAFGCENFSGSSRNGPLVSNHLFNNNFHLTLPVPRSEQFSESVTRGNL